MNQRGDGCAGAGIIQVLQTEINKPMTVALFAENGKVPGWFGRLALGGAGFFALWALMGVVGKRREA